MKERKSNELIGIIILALGIVLALKSVLNLGDIVFFHGWWTLLLLIPAIYSMIKSGINKGNIALAVAAVVLFINSRTHFIGFIFGRLIIPIILLAIGFRILMKNRNEKSQY